MLIQEDQGDSPFLLRSYTASTAEAPGYFVINHQHYPHSIIIRTHFINTPDELTAWPKESAEQLDANDAKALCQGLENSSGIILLGTGPRFIIPPASFRDAVLASKIGMEFMDTAAACRSFIALMAEGRQVVAALIL